MRREWPAIIDGQAVWTGRGFRVDEPATGEALATVTSCSETEVARAIAAAHRAFQNDWRWRTARERGAILQAAAQLMRVHRDELGRLETLETGKPLHQAVGFDMVAAADAFALYGGLSESLAGQVIPQGPILSYTIMEPYGVVGVILPFNWPPIHLAVKIAPALAAGNTVVVKPAEQAPLTVIRIVEMLNDVFPAGVINVVPGDGPVAGSALVADERVRKVSFTGSSATGRTVLRAAAENLTPATLELGGKNPLLVFDDADLELATVGAVEGMFFNQGEACTAASRILVHERVMQEFLARFTAAVGRLKVGDGLDETTDLGPMVTRAQQQRVLEYVRVGIAEGARVLVQGEVPDDSRLRGGFFVPPTVLTNVKPHMRVAQEEIFGPVAVVMSFADEDEALTLANGGDYGLVAAVYTRDMLRAQRVARHFDSGVVFINNYNRGFLGTPFGGVGSSGYGREQAVTAINDFAQPKTVRIPSGIGTVPMWEAARRVCEPE
jgi:acyl-CoA reductase-like NAD-dependent aldehyde dehydrogenase